MATSLSSFKIAIAIGVAASAILIGAWIFEAVGYTPCDLCLKQRYAYYLGIPLAFGLAGLIAKGASGCAIRIGFVALALVFFTSMIFGGYHAGVEWKLWQGPQGCTGATPQAALSPADFLAQLQTVKVVRCDDTVLRVFGFSLAAWNAALSAGLAALALVGYGSSSLSQYK